MAIIYTDLTNSIIIERKPLFDEYIMHINPVYQHWHLTIILDGFSLVIWADAESYARCYMIIQILIARHVL